MSYKIEKNISHIPKYDKYPLRDMVPGDSFLVPFADVNHPALASATSHFTRRNPDLGIRFSIRKQPDGYRVFCLAREAK